MREELVDSGEVAGSVRPYLAESLFRKCALCGGSRLGERDHGVAPDRLAATARDEHDERFRALGTDRQPKFLSAPSHSVRVPEGGNSAVLIANSVSVLGTDLAPRERLLGRNSILGSGLV